MSTPTPTPQPSPDSAANILTPTEASFESEVLDSSTPTVVDFWAPWCPPCRLLKPELEAVAKDYRGKMNFAFINVDEHPAIAAAFDVTGIPAVFIMRGRKVVDAWTGYITRPAIVSKIAPHVA